MKTTELEKIDPAFTYLKDFSRVSKNTALNLQKMRQDVLFVDGIFSAKEKCLAAALWSIGARCEPCLKFYTLKAKELGATEEEVGEFFAIASTMGGCVGETWAVKAFAAFKSGGDATDPSCAC